MLNDLGIDVFLFGVSAFAYLSNSAFTFGAVRLDC